MTTPCGCFPWHRLWTVWPCKAVWYGHNRFANHAGAMLCRPARAASHFCCTDPPSIISPGESAWADHIRVGQDSVLAGLAEQLLRRYLGLDGNGRLRIWRIGDLEASDGLLRRRV